MSSKIKKRELELGRRDRAQKRKALATGSYNWRRCTNCQAIIAKKASDCWKCGAALNA